MRAEYERRYKELERQEQENLKAYYNYEMNIKRQIDNYNELVATLGNDDLPILSVENVEELDVEYLQAIYLEITGKLGNITKELDELLGEDDLGGFDI